MAEVSGLHEFQVSRTCALGWQLPWRGSVRQPFKRHPGCVCCGHCEQQRGDRRELYAGLERYGLVNAVRCGSGEFNWVHYYPYGFGGNPPPAPVACVNVGASTVQGHRLKIDGALPSDNAPILSMALDQDDRIWVAREVGANPGNDETIWVYKPFINQADEAVLDRLAEFDYGPNGKVNGLVFDPGLPGTTDDDQMIVCGDFSSRPVRNAFASGLLQEDIPARNVTAYSTTIQPAGISSGVLDFGAHRDEFRIASNAPLACIALRLDGVRANAGLVFSGFALTAVTAERTNLAATGPNGELRQWGPRTHGPVRAMALAETQSTQYLYFAGEGYIYGLPQNTYSSPHNHQPTVVAVVEADNAAIQPENWYAELILPAGTPVVHALATTWDYLIIGGDYTRMRTYSGFNGAAAVLLYDPGVVTGSQDPETWNPEIDLPSGRPVVRALAVDSSYPYHVYLGGNLRDAGTTTIHGLARCESPVFGTGDVDTGFDMGFEAGSEVWDMKLHSGGIYLAGGMMLSTVTYSALHWTGSSFAFLIQTDGLGRAIAATPGGDVIIGGDFEHLLGAGTPHPARSGLLAIDANGNLLNWVNDVLAQNGEFVGCLFVNDTTDVVWVGGDYTGGIQDAFLTNFAVP